MVPYAPNMSCLNCTLFEPDIDSEKFLSLLETFRNFFGVYIGNSFGNFIPNGFGNNIEKLFGNQFYVVFFSGINLYFFKPHFFSKICSTIP